jgi:hypothetical protein
VSGTPISTDDEFLAMQSGGEYYLTADITLPRTYSKPFEGTLNGNGKTVKGMPSAEIFVMTRKIDKKKYIIGLSFNRRIAGTPSGKTGIEAWFEESRDRMVEESRLFAEGYEKEQAYFDHCMIDHFRNSVGMGQLHEAEYQDKLISRAKSKTVLGITFTKTGLFIAMIILWSCVFHNIALGFIFALCMIGSFTLVTNKVKSKESDLVKDDQVSAEN